MRKAGIEEVHELSAGRPARARRRTRCAPCPARHGGDRRPLGGAKAAPLGYVVEGGGLRVYFAGDTDLFDEMEEIGWPASTCALIPVWGWGTEPRRGTPRSRAAARGAAPARPRVAVPIHWGTFFPIGQARRRPHFLTDPPHAFAHHAARIAPEVEVRILQPGESADLG